VIQYQQIKKQTPSPQTACKAKKERGLLGLGGPFEMITSSKTSNQDENLMSSVANFGTFSILDHLNCLNIVKETSTDYHCNCPLCDAGGFKIDKTTGKYNTFVCGCMDTDEGKKAVIQAIAPLEPSYQSPFRQIKPKAKALSLPLIEGSVTLAKFEIIPTDSPQSGKPSFIPNGIPENATQTTYRYSPTQFIKRFDWEDPSKPKGRDKTFRQCYINDQGEVIWGKGTDPWPLYRESEVITAKDWVLLQEGEVCVDTARCTLGLPSITLQGGNWSEDAIAAALTRLKEAGLPGLVFVTDNDNPGETKGKKVLTVSVKIDFPVILIPIVKLWKDAPKAGDLADWITWGIANGMNTEDFIKRLEAEIHNAVAQRSLEAQKVQQNEKPQEGLNADDLKIKIKAFIEEKDQAKREVMLYELRKMGIGEKGVNRIAAQLTQNGTIPRATRLSASEFRSRISGGKKWLVPGLIPQVGVTLITAPSGGAKSTFAFDLAGSVICGTSFMGETIKENGPVIFACSDEPTDESQERALLQGFFHSDDFEFLEQWNLGQMEMLEEAIADRLPKLVLVDSFDSIHREAGFDENATQASETIKQFNTLSQKYSCAFIVLHHENKDPKLSGVNKSRGSTAIVASANAHIRIIGKDDNPEAKYIKIEKMRGGATRTILCSVDYHNVRFEPEVNLEFEQDKDSRTALVNFLRSNLNRWFEVQELNHYLEWSGKGIYRYLKQLTDRGEINRKPNSMGRKGMVYGIVCTDGDNPVIDLTPPSLVKSVSQEKIISETIDIQSVEVSHNLVTSESHLVTSESYVTINELPKNLTLSDSHTIDQKEGDIEGGGLTSQSVSTSESVETASIIEVKTPNNSEPANHQIVQLKNVIPGQQNLEPTKNETGFTFELGDRVINTERPHLSLEVVSIDPDGKWCRCKDEFGSELYACSQLVPDEF
jgi:hypothetical protein